MPHITQLSEIRFYADEDVPSDARLVHEKVAAAMLDNRKYSTKFGDFKEWCAEYGPSSERTVPALAIIFQCDCQECQLEKVASGEPAP